MIVFVLIGNVTCELNAVIGIYTNKENAEKKLDEAKTNKDSFGENYDSFSLYPIELDAEIEYT